MYSVNNLYSVQTLYSTVFSLSILTFSKLLHISYILTCIRASSDMCESCDPRSECCDLIGQFVSRVWDGKV